MVQKIKVSGIAITEGVSRNGIMYKREELDKFASTLTDRPILKDHESKTDNVIGKVKEGFSSEGGRKVHYSGWIKEDGTGIVEKIKDGRISEVSIGAMCGKLVRESEDSEVLIAKNMTAMELSTTPTPGVQGTSIMQAVQKRYEEDIDEEIKSHLVTKESIKLITEAMHNYECPGCDKKMKSEKDSMECPDCDMKMKMKESHSMSSKLNEEFNMNQKEVKMESTQEKTEVIQTQSNVNEAIELKAKLAAAEQALASIKEAQRLDTIASYKAKSESKKLVAQDVSNMTIETVKALIAVIDSMPSVTESKIDVTEKAIAKTKAPVASVVESSAFDGYVTESSTLGGTSFFKYY